MKQKGIFSLTILNNEIKAEIKMKQVKPKSEICAEYLS